MPPIDLILWNDDLDTVQIVCTRNRVLEDANGANDLAILYDAEFSALVGGSKVARITDDLFGFDSFGSAAHTNKFTVIIGNDLINRFVEHVGTTVDSGEARKCLR
jgi:hypothetical protein